MEYICEVLQHMVSFDNTEIAFGSKSNASLKKAKLLFSFISHPALVNLGKSLTDIALAIHFPIKPFVKPTIFKQFVGGETIEECSETIAHLGKYKVGTILDYSVEGKETDEAFDKTCQELIKTIERASKDKNIPFSVFKVSGIAKVSVLEKAGKSETLSEADAHDLENIKKRVYLICETASKLGVRIFIDAEETWIQDCIDNMTEEMMAKFNRERVIVYNTVQMYRRDRLEYVKMLYQKATETNFKVGLKIVRGAYMEKESLRAAEKGYQNPIQPNKETTDRDYNAALEFCIQRTHIFEICAGTHNEQSSLFLTELMQKFNIEKNDTHIWFSQLLGMSDHISFNLAHDGYNVAKYVPYGPVREVMPYLIRRAQENTSVKGQTGRELSLLQKEVRRRKETK